MEDVRAWFIREVPPFEPVLTRYLRRNWRRKDDMFDLRRARRAQAAIRRPSI